MSNTLRKWLIIVLAIVMIVSCGYFVYEEYNSLQAQKEYEEARELVGNISIVPPATTTSSPTTTTPKVTSTVSTVASSANGSVTATATSGATTAATTAATTTTAPPPDKSDLAALQAINPDILGWIEIPDSPISYPLLQGDDNDYYLKHTWKGRYSKWGSIYVDYRNASDLSDFNTIIYGHHMGDNTMFHPLHNYKKDGYLEEHPYVYIAVGDEVYCYEIFAAHEADAITQQVYKREFADADSQQEYIDFCIEMSVLDTDKAPVPGDRIITLSTCSRIGSDYTTRWVVQAYCPQSAFAPKGE